MSCLGCPDVSSPPPVSYTLPDCPGGSPCEEFSFSECTTYKGANLVNLGVTNGMSLKRVLVELNKKITGTALFKTQTITVSNTQTTTVVEYINNLGNLVSKSVSAAQSPQTICAQEGSAVKLSGTGVLSGVGAVCTTTTT